MRVIINPANLTDQYLVASLQEQDVRGFELLYQKYWDHLIYFANGYVRNHEISKEIVQELFIQLYAKGFQLKTQTSLKPYLRKALRNRIINYMRDQAVYKKHINKAVHKETSGSNSAISSLDMVDMKKRVRYYLSLMSENCRTVFILNREHQLTIRQIAAQLQKPEDTVEKQLRRAVSFLKKHLN